MGKTNQNTSGTATAANAELDRHINEGTFAEEFTNAIMKGHSEKEATEIANKKTPSRLAPVTIEEYKGFTIRTSKKGLLAEKSGGNLGSYRTIEQVRQSIDRQIEIGAWRKQQQEELAQRKREQEEQEAKKLTEVLAVIPPIREFEKVHGLELLERCVALLKQEERERNVPENWEELANLCECVGDKLSEYITIEVSKFGVVEKQGYNSDFDAYAVELEFGLQEFLDRHSETVEELEEEKAEGKEE